MASKGRRRDRIFFIYDHSMLKKEEDDPKSAILFFTPDSVSDDTQCSIVGHLMGMMDFLSSTVSISHPRVIKLETDKYIIKRVNRYSLVLQGFPNESNIHLTNQLEHLYKCFVTFHGSIDSLSLRFKGRHAAFLDEFKSIWTEILDLDGFDQNLLTQAFNYLPYVDLPKNASHLFFQASHILQSSQRRPYVLAGMILYKNGVVCSQLTPELTKLLILAQSQLPCFLLHTDFEMPIGCKLVTVFLMDDDYISVHPLHQDAKRHYKAAEFSKHRESVVITKEITQSRTEKSPKRPQPCPQNGDSNLLGQGHSRISLSRKEISSWSDRRQITSIVGVPLVECKSGERKEEEEIGVMHGFSANKDHFEDRDGKHWSPNNKDNKKSKYKIQSDTHSEPCREKDRIDLFEKNKESQKKNTQTSENAERSKFEVGGSTEEETVSELENGDIDKTHEKRPQEVEGNTSVTNKLHNINSDLSELETLDIDKYSVEVNVDSDGFVCGTDEHLPDHDSVVHTDIPRDEDEFPSSENQQDNTKCNEQTTTVTQLEAISASLMEENKIPSSENQQDNTKCNEQTTTVTQLEAISASLMEENKIPSSENQQDNTKCNEQTTTVTQLEAISASLMEENKIPSSENQQDNTKCNEQTTTVTQLEAISASLMEENKIPSSENQQDNTKCNEQTTTVTLLEAISPSRLEENKIPSSENQQDNTKCNEQTTFVTQLEAISASLIDQNSSDKQQVFETEKEQIPCPVKDDIFVKEQEHIHNIKSSVTEACNNEKDFHGHAQVMSKVLVETKTLEVTTELGNTEKATKEVSVNDLENYKTESDKQTVRKSLLLISSIARSGLHSNDEKENIDPESIGTSDAQMVGKPAAEQTNYGLIDNLSKKSSASFSSSDDMPSSTQFGHEQFKFQSHSSESNTEVVTSEKVKDIMTSFVSHNNKAEKRNTVQRELDDSVKNNSQIGMTSFWGSFSSDQSSDSTLSKVWTPDMDGLNDLTLYVQRHSDISLLLLLENPVQNEEAVLHMLWKSAVPPIADLDFYIKECLEQSADKQSFLDQYNYLKYEGFSHQLKGNSLDILENSELPFQQLASNVHEEFLGSQYMYDVLLRTQTYACHGHRTPVAEHYFQLNVAPRLTSGLPVPNDPVFCLDLLARKKMENTSNAIL